MLRPSIMPSWGRVVGGSAVFDFKNLILGAKVVASGKWYKLVISSEDKRADCESLKRRKEKLNSN
ncbi:MAG: hypothetical protein AAB799_01740, partial [Patescibacteria group bacterium]